MSHEKPATASYSPSFLDGRVKPMLIGAEWVESRSGRTFDTFDPATGTRLASVCEAGEDDIGCAVQAARAAIDGPWSRFKPYDRQALLLKLADLVERNYEEIAWLDTLDMGAPITRLLAGKRRAVGLLRYYAGMATAIHGDTVANSAPGDVLSYTRKEPVGVVGAIVPWNGPFGMAVWKMGPVLATGCTGVLKPSEQSPLSALRFGELLLEAGMPPGVINIVPGTGAAGAALAAHPGVDKVCFTGSTETGRRIVQASAGNLKRLSLELGGKSPNIVFADANLDLAVTGAAMAIFSNSGQICSAGSRLFVEETIYDEFAERLARYVGTLRVGAGSDPDTVIGPLVSAGQFERVSNYLESGRQQGAGVLTGGGHARRGKLADGWFIQPTVFSRVRDDMRIAREEIFGPVLSMFSFRTMEEVVRRANDTEFGLGSGVWTRDVNKALRMAASLHAGSVWVNCYQVMDPTVPFGGYKSSGYGRESGRHHVEEFLNTKAVWIQNEVPL